MLIALGPYLFKITLMVEGGFKYDLKSLIELVESSRHRRFLNMISTAID